MRVLLLRLAGRDGSSAGSADTGHRPRRTRLTRAVLAVALVTGLAACGNGDDEPHVSTPSAEGAVVRIEIRDFAFVPSLLRAKVGDTVEVVNRDDSAEHTVTAVDKSFDTGPLKGGQHAEFKLVTAGTISYLCSIHPYMTGTIAVEP